MNFQNSIVKALYKHKIIASLVCLAILVAGVAAVRNLVVENQAKSAYEKGVSAFEAHDWAAATTDFTNASHSEGYFGRLSREKLITLNHIKDSNNSFEQGLNAIKNGYLDLAEASFKKVISEDPNFIEAQAKLAEIVRKRNGK